ncbi:hypothetical protein [Desulfovibrio sp. Fe33]|uniref:hypothetical protein n=1 Tax=Desulfovibrio sp. Fe33 TaxID=3020842 RepID=UPI00234C5AB2|nr:hypothetical protein [Desulfovibrio sp. Fe33]
MRHVVKYQAVARLFECSAQNLVRDAVVRGFVRASGRRAVCGCGHINGIFRMSQGRKQQEDQRQAVSAFHKTYSPYSLSLTKEKKENSKK